MRPPPRSRSTAAHSLSPGFARALDPERVLALVRHACNLQLGGEPYAVVDLRERMPIQCAARRGRDPRALRSSTFVPHGMDRAQPLFCRGPLLPRPSSAATNKLYAAGTLEGADARAGQRGAFGEGGLPIAVREVDAAAVRAQATVRPRGAEEGQGASVPIETIWEQLREFGAVASAAGSFAALLGGIVLARRSRGTRLHVDADLRSPRSRSGSAQSSEPLVWLAVTNRGSRPVTLQSVAWGFSGEPAHPWSPPPGRLTASLPVTLADGQSANFVCTLEAFLQSHGALLGRRPGGLGDRVGGRRLQARIQLHGGERIDVAAGPALHRRLRQELGGAV
jgi:hypothetical protein